MTQKSTQVCAPTWYIACVINMDNSTRNRHDFALLLFFVFLFFDSRAWLFLFIHIQLFNSQTEFYGLLDFVNFRYFKTESKTTISSYQFYIWFKTFRYIWIKLFLVSWNCMDSYHSICQKIHLLFVIGSCQ